MRGAADLTQEELAEAAGTSQPTVAAYEAGRAEPRLSTLERLAEAAGHDLIVEVRPRVRRGAMPLTGVASDLRRVLDEEGEPAAWRRLLDFVDDFRGSTLAGKRWLMAEPPGATGSNRFDAAIAALVEFLCVEAGVDHPGWTDESGRFAEPWWFVSGLRGYEAMAFRDAPISFVRHGVFVNEGAFDRV